MGYLNLEEVFKKKGEDVSQLSHFFICGGNQSLIEAYHDLFRVGAPAYGGSAAYYRADESQLDARQADPTAATLRFDGQKFMGSKTEEVATVADALARLSGAIYRGVFISYVSIGPAGRDWLQKVYATLLGQAVGQGILP